MIDMARQFVGLCQNAALTDLERREINRYVLACRNAVEARMDADWVATRMKEWYSADAEELYGAAKANYDHWHYLAHVRLMALQRIQGYKTRQEVSV